MVDTLAIYHWLPCIFWTQRMLWLMRLDVEAAMRRGTARGRRATSQRWRLSVARSDCRFQGFLDSAVFAGPEPAKPLKSRRVHFLVADASEPVATPVTRKIMLVAHWGVPAES